MAAYQFTLSMGQKAESAVGAAGSAVGTDTIRVNFDVTAMKKVDALELLGEIVREVQEGIWPRN